MKSIAMRSIDVYRSIAYHDGIVAYAGFRTQGRELLPFMEADVTAANELEVISQPEMGQDPFGEDRQLGGADSQHRSAVLQDV